MTTRRRQTQTQLTAEFLLMDWNTVMPVHFTITLCTNCRGITVLIYVYPWTIKEPKTKEQISKCVLVEEHWFQLRSPCKQSRHTHDMGVSTKRYWVQSLDWDNKLQIWMTGSRELLSVNDSIKTPLMDRHRFWVSVSYEEQQKKRGLTQVGGKLQERGRWGKVTHDGVQGTSTTLIVLV